jgi:protein-S-isoprenylcysteine O-methyltransferase Ste14
MNEPALLLVLLNFAVIGLLPRLFFRRTDRLGPWWWATALPFILCPLLLIRAYLAGAAPAAPASGRALALVAVAAGTASTALIFYTIGTHRTPVALWHQEEDEPQSIVTHGAYRRIRHPFYTSYLLAFVAALAVFPDLVLFGLSVYTLAILNHTARKEERRLCASTFGADYRTYMTGTGRFFPSTKG